MRSAWTPVATVLLVGAALCGYAADRPVPTPEEVAQYQRGLDLLEAARVGDARKVRELLDQGAGIDHATYMGDTALILAARNGQVETLELLLSRGAAITNTGMQGRSALLNALAGDCTNCVRALLAAGADPDQRDSRGDRALHVAIDQRHSALVPPLLAAGADVTLTNMLSETALHRALDRECYDLVRPLLDAGADPNAADFMGETPLCEALMKEKIDIVGLLCERGADPNRYCGDRPMVQLPWVEAVPLLKILLDHGADPNARNRANGQTALHWCGANASTYLLARGADPDARDNEYATPLHENVVRGMRWNVASLLDGGADIHARDANGLTPLLLARQVQDTTTVALLQRRGAREGPEDPPLDAVTFLLPAAPGVTNVGVYGHFIGWSTWPLARDVDGDWCGTFSLYRGVYRYQFVVNGRHHADPANPYLYYDSPSPFPASILQTKRP